MYCKYLRDQYKINLILVEINLKQLQIKFHTPDLGQLQHNLW
jgi:hypothetical protein